MSGTVAPCFSASARNCAASVRKASPLNATAFVTQKPIKDRVQQQRVFGRLAKGFGLFDQHTRPLRSRLGFGRRMPLHMHKWRYERNL